MTRWSAADVEDGAFDSCEQAMFGRRDRIEPSLRGRGEDATVDRTQARSCGRRGRGYR